MNRRFRSPTRQNLDTDYQSNSNQQPQPQQCPPTSQTPELESQMSNLALKSQDRPEYAAATAERSPGRIAGRNRDTAMFDPKRGTYMPYGGFDSMIDEYYTEGDSSGIMIPAPSQMQKREESSSPHRRALKPNSNNTDFLAPDHNERPSDHISSEMERQRSGTSGFSNQSEGMPGNGQVPRMRPAQAYVERKPAQYYDDEPYYENIHQETHNEHAPPLMPASVPYDRRGSSGSQERPNMNRPRPRYDDNGYDNAQQFRAPMRDPRGQRLPQSRGQRPMDGGYQGRPQPNEYGAYPSNHGRDPRSIDPRNGPRSNNDPRSRQGPPRQGRPPNGPFPSTDRMARRPSPGEDRRYREEQSFRQQNQAPSRGPPGSAAPYPASPSDYRPAVVGQQPPHDRKSPQIHSGPPIPSSGPISNPVQQRGPSPAQQYMQRPNREPSPQMQRPPQQPQQPLHQPSNRPEPSRTHSARTDDTSEMQLQAEPLGRVTLQELNTLRKEASAKSNDSAVQLKLIKRLIEASTDLADEGGKTDSRQTKKNRDDYNREALRNLKQLTAQEKPDPEALFFMANCYGNGALSLEVDHERAFQLYESAAKLQHPASAYRTAVCLEIGAGTRQDPPRAVRFYERAAEYGDVAAMYKIGMISLRGLLEQKAAPRTAVTWLQKAAERADIDNPHALHELALLYEKGDIAAGIAQNEAFAKDLFTKSAKLHYAPSQFRLGYAYEYGTLGCPVDPRRSIAWFSRGAERGDPESELSLSGWYLTGSDGILAQNDREAYLWGRKAAEKGLAKAEFAVGYFYESGIGTGVDVEEAIKWYKRAATAGQKKAQERLVALNKNKKQGAR